MVKKEHNFVHVVIECPPVSKVVRIFPFLRSFEKLLKVKTNRNFHVQSLHLYMITVGF